MPNATRPDGLEQLHAELVAQRARIAHLERRRRLPRRFLPLAMVGLLVALMPLSILAAGPVFSDLSTAAPVHQPNIQAIGDAGITTGFEDSNDPTKRTYNPKGLVTREEMASFLARTAGLGGNAPVVNALTAQTVPDGSVTAAKLSPTGSTAGQVLVSTGSGVAWQAPVPSESWVLFRGFSGSVPIAIGADTTLESTAVPAGRYTVTGVVMLSTGGTGGRGFCFLSGDTRIAHPYNLAANTQLTLPLTALQISGAPWELSIVCNAEAGSVSMDAGTATAKPSR